MNGLELLEGHIAIKASERAIRARAFAPPPKLSLSEWADAYRVLSGEGSAEPGRWRTARAPFLREIMDACSDPNVERVVFMKPAQIGGTEVANNFVGYFMDQDPSPVLVLQPTLEVAHLWSKERLDPMLRDTPKIRNKVHSGARREKDQSILRKVFPGGYLAIVGANSASGLRARPVRAVLADEVDGYAQSAKGSAKKDAKGGSTGEGDPLSLAMKRTTTFWNRKILEVSTPTEHDLSRIERDYDLSDGRRYFVPCPHCAYKQVLVWHNLQWEPGDHDTAQYRCGIFDRKTGEIKAGCGNLIGEHHKSEMLRLGEWMPQRPGRRIVGFWLNGLYSPWLDWPTMAREWDDARDKPDELKVFVNTRLAESWRGKGDLIDEATLSARRYAFPTEVPMWVGLLTASVDVQGDRLEVMIKGWGKARENATIRHEQVWGDPAKRDVWDRLDLILFRDYVHESGAKLRPAWTFVDSGGHHTSEVYTYCKGRKARNVYASKGIGEPGRHPVGRASKGNKAKVALFPLGVIALKDTLFAMMRTDTRGPNFMHFAQTITDEYLRQLTSERRVIRYINGRPTHTYVLIGGRTNEALDLECMALAALIASGREEQLGNLVTRLAPTEPVPVEPEPPSVQIPQPTRPAPRRNSWATGGGTWKLR